MNWFARLLVKRWDIPVWVLILEIIRLTVVFGLAGWVLVDRVDRATARAGGIRGTFPALDVRVADVKVLDVLFPRFKKGM